MKKIILVVAVLVIQGCAFTDAQLDVAHSSGADVIGPISEAESIVFLQPALADERPDQVRIGWKKNGYGQQTADITTVEPVEVIVGAAIEDAMTDNGHAIGEDGAVLVTGTVDRFWFDVDVNFWSVEFFGDIQSTLQFLDAASSDVIYESTYQGNYKEQKAGGLEKTWTEVMAKALDALVENIVFDEELAEALMEWRQS